MTVNNEVGRCFILEVVENKTLEDSHLADLTKVTQDGTKALTEIFDTWLQRAVEDDDVDLKRNPRFVDFLVIDEDSLRPLATLPKETISLGPVTIPERRVGSPSKSGSLHT
jgi:hypothetical protein